MGKTLLFDIDGTLIETGGAGSRALAAALSRTFSIENPRRVAMHGRTDAGIIAELFDVHGIEASSKAREAFLTSYFDHLPQVLAELKGRVLPGVRALLDRLAHDSSTTVTLLTGNMARSARMKLDHFGIGQYFSGGVFGDHHRDRRELGKVAIETLSPQIGRPIEPSELLVIGDTQLDIECARAIGCPVLAVATGGCSVSELKSCGADWVVEDLTDPRIMDWL